MGIRTRVATALTAAAVIPLVAAFAAAAWFLPRTAAEDRRDAAQVVSAAAAADLAQACEAVADRAALVAMRLQLAAALALVAGTDPGEAVAAEAGAAVASVGARDPRGGTAVVPGPGLDPGRPGGEPLAATGDLGALAAREGQGASPGCTSDAVAAAAGDGGVGVVVQSVPVRAGDEVLATATALVAADGVLAATLATAGSPAGLNLGVVDPTDPADPAGEVLAATDPALADPGRTDDREAVGAVAREAAATGARPGGAGRVVTAEAGGATIAARGLPGGSDATVVAVADPPALTGTLLLVGLLLLAVAAAGGAVALATVALTRGITRLADVSRRLTARTRGTHRAPDPSPDLRADLVDLAGAPEPEVRHVSTTIDDLMRTAQESEAGVSRATASVVDAFGRFGAALDRAPEQEGLLRAVAEAALLAADARLAVVSFSPPGEDAARPAPGGPGAPAGEHTVMVFLAGGSAWSRMEGTPVVLSGDPDAIDLSDPEDLDAATTGMRLLRDLAAHAVSTGRAVSADLPGEGSGVVAPLRVPGHPHAGGYVAVARDAGSTPLDPAALGMLATLARHAAAALVNVRRHHLAARLSVTDALTGIGNVRMLTQTLAREVERAGRYGHNLSVLMLDLDRFKSINDAHGHARGDMVLTELAHRVVRCVRDIDTVARYGGEEFCVLLPETGPEGAEVVAQRVLTAVAGEPFVAPGATPLHVTVSIGVAVFPDDGRTGGEVMRAADRALYEAKRAGRDRIVVARPATATAGADGAGDGRSAAGLTGPAGIVLPDTETVPAGTPAGTPAGSGAGAPAGSEAGAGAGPAAPGVPAQVSRDAAPGEDGARPAAHPPIHLG